MRYNILLVAVLAVVLSTSVVAQAQRPVGPYMPSKPTLSPYLWLTRPNAGPLPNYQTFVQPLQNQAQINGAQQANIDLLQQQTQQVQQTQQLQLQQTQLQQQQQLQNQIPQMRITPATVAPTGIGAGYNNYSHYYGGGGGSAQGASSGNRSKGKSAGGGSSRGSGSSSKYASGSGF